MTETHVGRCEWGVEFFAADRCRGCFCHLVGSTQIRTLENHTNNNNRKKKNTHTGHHLTAQQAFHYDLIDHQKNRKAEMGLIMARETILSPSHYRLTAFVFSYYSPVKTRGVGCVRRGSEGVMVICHTFPYWKTSYKKRHGTQSAHLGDTVAPQHGTMLRFVRCCIWLCGSTENHFLFFPTPFMMSHSRAKLGIHVVQRLLGVEQLMQVAVTHACTPKAKAHRC